MSGIILNQSELLNAVFRGRDVTIEAAVIISLLEKVSHRRKFRFSFRATSAAAYNVDLQSKRRTIMFLELDSRPCGLISEGGNLLEM
jgi:hypothetical protein